MSKVFNIYCDESSVEGDGKHQYLVIGAFIIPRDKKKVFLSELHGIKNEHALREVKWSKTSNASLSIAKQVVDLFFRSEYASFTSIVINKKKVALDQFHNGSMELAFYKFYYYLLRHKMQSGCKYYISLDKKPVSIKNRVGVLKNFLAAYIKSSRTDCVIKNLQEYPSDENELIQISDLFTGAIAASYNFGLSLKSVSKNELIKYIEKVLGRKISTPTSYIEEKFNVFLWEPKKIPL